MKIVHYILLITMITSMFSCGYRNLPKTKLSPIIIERSIEYSGDSLIIYLDNPLHCPMRFTLNSEQKSLNSILSDMRPILIPALMDTNIVHIIQKENQGKVSVAIDFGDVNKPVLNTDIEYPFPKGKSYKIIQGNQSKPTHYTIASQYAIDFSHRLNDTISSVSNGYVVGLIDGYKYGGSGKKWKSYGNYILIYDPVSGRFFQYGHLVENGSLVELGTKITAGDPIGLAGMTGQTNVQHLHFNCLIPSSGKKSLKSSQVKFSNGVTGKSLKRGNRVSH